MTVLCLSLQQKRNPHKSQRDLGVILCETAVLQIFFAMTILEIQATIPTLHWVIQRQLPVFCLFPMDVHCTLLNLRDVSLLGDSLACASVPSFFTICVTKHLPVCATNGCLRLNTIRLPEYKIWTLLNCCWPINTFVSRFVSCAEIRDFGGKLLNNFKTVLNNTVVGIKSLLVLELVSRTLLSRPDHPSK